MKMLELGILSTTNILLKNIEDFLYSQTPIN